jgi:WD40 repeat protein
MGAVSQLWSVPAAGGTPQVVALTGEDNRRPSFGRSRPTRLVWEHTLEDSNIWRLDLVSHKVERIVASTRMDSSPQLSPDGRSLVFVSDRTGNFQLWRAGADGSNPVQLTKYSSEYPGSARWSPDAGRIAFDLRGEEGRAIFVMDMATGATRQWTRWREGSRPSWSRDGRWIYFGDRAPDNRFEVWKVPTAAPGEPERVTHGSGTDPFDSPDGRTIYFARDNGGLWSIPAAGGAITPVGPQSVQGGWFSITARGLFFADLYPGGAPGVSVPSTPKPIWLLPAPGGKPVEVGRIEGAVRRETPDFTMSADGRTAFFSILDTSASQIRMLEGWP